MKLINADKVIKTLRERKKLFCRNRIEFRMLPPDQKARVDEIDTCISELINAKPISIQLMTSCRQIIANTLHKESICDYWNT